LPSLVRGANSFAERADRKKTAEDTDFAGLPYDPVYQDGRANQNSHSDDRIKHGVKQRQMILPNTVKTEPDEWQPDCKDKPP
jgi:hypothetical protein